METCSTPPRAFVTLGAVLLAVSVPGPVSAAILQVGPQREFLSIATAASRAKNGDTVEVDAGEYLGDVAVWHQDDLKIRAIGGRAKLVAAGKAAEGKGIWVISGGKIDIQGFDFIGAKVSDRNGAGIRLERGKLQVRDCVFSGNQNGILTSNDPNSVLQIENSEFGNNGSGDGFSHNLYVGAIARLTVTGSYFHHAKLGHLLKSRAAENFIQYNRLTDEVGGRASYELDLPNGGLAYVIGNIVEQGSQAENPTMISFGAEGYKWPRNELYLINNTLADDRPKPGKFLAVSDGPVSVTAINNLLVDGGSLEVPSNSKVSNNPSVDWDQFVRASRLDYRLAPNAAVIGKAVDAGSANGISLNPSREYVHPRQTRALPSGIARSPGALQIRP